MMTRHNKKRNSGLLYEFLVRKISRSLVEGDNKSANVSKSILKKYFTSGTEIHKEYRLVNALVNVPVGSEAVAQAVLQEARNAAQRFDAKALRSEKDDLIREINHAFGPESVYAESVPSYKSYATAGTLVKYWREEKELDLSTVIKYEKVLIESLARPAQAEEIEEVDTQVDNLVVKVATDKMQRKYESKLNKAQSQLINLYAVENNADGTRQMIESIVEEALTSLSEYSGKQNEAFTEKASAVSENIRNLNTLEIDDSVIAKTLEIVELNEQLQGAMK
tara:strand:+ start:696 stop:1532 length:837 start_codon:yes stop_codon:yes gene_type:complete